MTTDAIGGIAVAAICLAIAIYGVVEYRRVRGEGLSELAVIFGTLQLIAIVVIGSLTLYGLVQFLGNFIRVTVEVSS